jgi:hypothetical protein
MNTPITKFYSRNQFEASFYNGNLVPEKISAELESIACEALASFKITQSSSDYSDAHWSKRLEKLLNQVKNNPYQPK